MDETEISNTMTDVPEQIDFNFGLILERLDNWIDGAIRLLPNIVLSLIVLVAFYFIGKLVRRLVYRQASKTENRNLGEVLGGFIQWSIALLGFLLAATIVIPTLKPGDLIAGLGVSSVAIGFAFKDILQNWMAGLLILLRKPFDIHDQIEVNGYEGTVERIETRATIISTYDGQQIVIPNSDIYTNAVQVKTAKDKRRSQYDIGIGYGDNIADACEVIRNTLASIPEIEQSPAPEALPWDLAPSWVTIRVRWWTGSRRAEMVKARSAVVHALKDAMDAAGIDMPFETHVELFHDQTEDTDKIPGQQREGWPASASQNKHDDTAS